MEKKEYLSEERYQQSKKKVTKISLIILIIGLIIGGGLIIAGVITQNNVKKTNEERYAEAYEESQDKIVAANERLSAIETEKEKLNDQIESKQYECDSLNVNSSSWFADKTKCQNEVSSLKSKLNDLEMEEFQLESANYTVYYTPVASIKYLIFYFIGAGVIVFTCMISGFIYMFAKRREITAFTAQQVMPIAKEGVEKIAPTVGTLAKEISKGIKEGIKDDKE